MKQRDTKTLDIFGAFTPEPVVERFPAERVRAASLPALVARAVSETLKDCGLPRAKVAADMSAFLDERVTEAMLNAYASAARESHNIPAHRLIALALVANDARLLNAVLEDADFIVVSAKYEPLIRREMAREARDRLDREIDANEAEWRARR